MPRLNAMIASGTSALSIVCLSLAAVSLAAVTSPALAGETLVPEELIGTWDVALHFSPDAPPSATVMEITAVNEDGTMTGSFYQSAFETARYRVEDDMLIISVITSDSTGPYATSGRLYLDGYFAGQTLSTGRDFLMAWTAERQ
ncbi:MAG: hypothetical protein GYB36_12185 [Alphaproteobacteria bacterium]|nr:hypothetical protein [Alphaproteobacteria bacterium]